MNDTHQRGDELVAEYLANVRQAAVGLTPERRDELVEDLREHIDAARAELAGETETDVRMLLHRLGDPAAIVAEASVGEPPPPAAPVLPTPPVFADPPPARSNSVLKIVLIVLAVVVGLPVLLCLAGFAFFMTVGNHQPSAPPPVEQSVPAPSR